MTYYRVRLQGSLRTLSELHIGSGEHSEQQPLENDELTRDVSEVLLDPRGNPYIPASTLRGFLRSQLEPEQAAVLFGAGNAADGSGTMGLVRLYDARWQSYPSGLADLETLPTMTRTSIDPVTQAAKQHHLASQRMIPVHTCFKLELEMDQRLTALSSGHAEAQLGELDDRLIQALLDALAVFNPQSTAQLGKGKSVGQGRLVWEQSKLEAIHLNDLKAWAQSKQKRTLNELYQAIHSDFTSDLSENLSTWTLVPFSLAVKSPLLINNPEDPELKANLASDEKGLPKQLFCKRVGADRVAVIPASSLKGWVRAQCRRILLTLTQNQQAEQVDALIDQLFGSTNQVGVLRFYDATVNYTDSDIHTQTFNAVDRFTGGVKERALYTVQALYPSQPFTAQLAYQSELKPWMKWLLLLVWRDAEDGDLVLGSDKAKGYGCLRLQGFKQGAQAYFTEHEALLQQGAAQLEQRLNLTTHTGVTA